MTKFYVYYLYSHLDPEGVRYVGKTNNPQRRFMAHISRKRGSAYRWVRAMGRENVSIYIVEEFETENECFEREKVHIAKLRALGCCLINVSEGGPLAAFYPRVPRLKKVREPKKVDIPKPIPRMMPATLTKLRKTEEMRQYNFALRLGISRNTLALYEKGRQPIPKYIALAATCLHRRMEAME